MKIIKKEILIDAPIAKVWEHITDPEKIAGWLMPNDFEATVGRQFVLDCQQQGKVSCVVKEIVPQQRLVYSFQSKVTKIETLVAITLAKEGKSTRLTLVHSGWDALPPGEQGIADMFDGGWDSRLEKLGEEIRNTVRPISIEKNKAVVREFTRVFKNEHNADGIDHLFAADFQHHFKPPLRAGLDGFKDIGRMMNTAFPDVVVTEDDLIANEDTVVERSSAVATHRAPMMGEPPTNKQVRWTEIHIYRLRDGKIVKHWLEWAMMDLLKQIGAIK